MSTCPEPFFLQRATTLTVQGKVLVAPLWISRRALIAYAYSGEDAA
jgi:hypothetical protein